MDQLKLVALDGEDLEVLSAHLQDAVLRIADMAYVKRDKRFAFVANRFDWEGAHEGDSKGKDAYQRRRTAVRFERVLGAKHKDINLNDDKGVLELLAVQYEVKDAPEGYIHLYFAGGGTVRLHVECIEAELNDLGAAWSTELKPEHEDDEDAAAGVGAKTSQQKGA